MRPNYFQSLRSCLRRLQLLFPQSGYRLSVAGNSRLESLDNVLGPFRELAANTCRMVWTSYKNGNKSVRLKTVAISAMRFNQYKHH